MKLIRKELDEVISQLHRELDKDFDEVVLCDVGSGFNPFVIPEGRGIPSRLYLSTQDWETFGLNQMDVFPVVVRTSPFMERSFA